MTTALLVFSAVVAALWLPIGWRFFASWRRRRNPVSLAICALCVFTAYTLSMGGWSVHSGLSQTIVVWAFSGTSLAVCLYFYFSFRWSRLKFKDQRSG